MTTAQRRWPASGKCREKGGGGGIVAEGLADVGVTIHVACSKNEASAELERIPAGPVLPVAGGPGPFSGPRVVAAEEMEQRSGLEAHGAICLPLLVHQEGERDADLLTEEAGVMPITEPNGSETRTLVPECLLVLAQLRDVLAAEYSAVMAEEDKDRRAVGPQRDESNLVTFGVG